MKAHLAFWAGIIVALYGASVDNVWITGAAVVWLYLSLYFIFKTS